MVKEIKKRKLKLYRDRLNMLLDLTQTINEDHSINELLGEFRILLHEELNVGKVLVFTLTNGRWQNVLSSGVKSIEVNSITPEKDLLHIERIENITLSPPKNLEGFDAVIPLFHRYKPIGYVLIGDVDEEQEGISPTIKHLKLIQIISNLIIVFAENRRMHKALLEQQAIQKELELASKIQTQLIPGTDNLPKEKSLSIYTIYHPHMDVGGDYYDFIKLSRNTIGFCVADVSGKGVSAALLMSNFQAVLRSGFKSKVSLKKLINQLNERVNENSNSEKFITMFIGKYNTKSRKLTYVNAGHLPPLLYNTNKDHITYLDKGCIGLGMLDLIPAIETGKITIPKGSKFLAFTDGLIELESDSKEIMSNEDFIKNIIKNSYPLSYNIEKIKEYIANQSLKHSIFDDISLIGIEFN
ncbi:PP2C family protein-serine/threonine phosphatase [Marinilabiliaceae bacterium ANBcel2]|nr:PP2C family protein-serine/threonine phosphatase [Marinilabiliaceae bacterium ANBcel2]